MLFCFSTRNTRQETNRFVYEFDKLEKGLEFLNQVVRLGDVLLEVYLSEEGQRMRLAVESFDGHSFLHTLKQMELEWTHRLTRSLQIQQQVNQRESCWYRSKLSYYEQRISHLELLINDTNRRCGPASSSRLSENPEVIARYGLLSGRYQVQLRQAYSIRTILLYRLYDPRFSEEA